MFCNVANKTTEFMVKISNTTAPIRFKTFCVQKTVFTKFMVSNMSGAIYFFLLKSHTSWPTVVQEIFARYNQYNGRSQQFGVRLRLQFAIAVWCKAQGKCTNERKQFFFNRSEKHFVSVFRLSSSTDI